MATVTQPFTGSALCPMIGVIILKDLESGAVFPVLGTELFPWFFGRVILFLFLDWVL